MNQAISINISELAKQLRRHEGLKLKPYRCTAGKLTIGYGRNLDDVGISEEEAEVLLHADIERCIVDMASLFPAFDDFPEQIKIVLCNMRYQLGYAGIRKFKKMIQAAQEKDWSEMAKQMKNSSWSQQTPNRAKELISIVEKVI